ncbi:hypothetical protein P3G55_16005 [Leptospira sp. 96542]|nr:hypothetical protein [Leptospira sp. 96542]
MNPSSKPSKKPATPTEATAKAVKKTATATKADKKNALKSSPAPETVRASKAVTPKLPKAKTADKKPKLVHDSYSLPKEEDAALGALKRRATTLGLKVKKNTLLRAGLLTLGKLGDGALLDALRALEEPADAAQAKAKAKEATKPSKAKPAKASKKPGKATPPAAATAEAAATQAP